MQLSHAFIRKTCKIALKPKWPQRSSRMLFSVNHAGNLKKELIHMATKKVYFITMHFNTARLAISVLSSSRFSRMMIFVASRR
jgi:hypothetical protein